VKIFDITVIGAGIYGVWQAYELARRGHRVTLVEASATPFVDSASQWAGAMLAPYCEEEASAPIVRALGLEAMALWRKAYPGIIGNGTLVVAAARDRSELNRFARATHGYEQADADHIARLEPDLAGRFQSGLVFADEAHMVPRDALAYVLEQAKRAGADVRLGTPATGKEAGIVVDCRGLAARDMLPTLRGVRGERLLLRSRDVSFKRPIRLLHPRHPLYVVPWGDGVHMVGATVIESEDTSPMTARSALELLGLAYALNPAFGEAEIIEMGVGLRPAFPDNVPKVVVRGDRLFVNGAYRHGFLLAPLLAEAAANYLEAGTRLDGIVVDR
jgi:glycine oxidase